jgi:hypothetical protein
LLTGPVSQRIETSSGQFSLDKQLPAGTYQLQYTSLPVGYYMSFPKNVPPPTITFTLGPACSRGNSNSAICLGGDIGNVNFGITNVLPWWQCQGGDCRIDTGITDKIPSTAACGTGAVASTSTTNTPMPGVLYGGDTTLDLGTEGARASADPYNWQVGGVSSDIYAPTIMRTSYSYLTTTLRQSGITSTKLTSVCPNLSQCVLPANLPAGVYQASSTVTFTMSSYTLPVGKQYVFIIDGDVHFNGEFHTPLGSSAVVSASGSIYVHKQVGIDPVGEPAGVCSTRCNIEGWFSADQSFIVEGNNDCAIGIDKRLNVCGAIVTNAGRQGGSVQNNRDMCAADRVAPSLTLFSRPDFIVHAAELIKYKTDVWRELSP